MSKVVVERPRVRHGEKSRKWGLRLPYDPESDYEDYSFRTGRKHRHGINSKIGGNKQFTDLLGPLKRYLRSRVGKNWDETYSEVCANLDKRKTTGAHIFSHLEQYVDTNCWIGAETGTVYYDGEYGTRTPYWFYVHPWTGLLCDSENEGYRYKSSGKKHPITEVPIRVEEGVHEAYKYIDGIWYYTKYDYVTKFRVKLDFRKKEYFEPYQDPVYNFKRQLNKKELKKLGLSNKALKFV